MGYLYLFCIMLLCIAWHSPVQAAEPQPETATGWRTPEQVSSQHGLVVSANPLATSTGQQILLTGGSAMDALIAMQLVLGLVEPQSSGIGGGSFLLYWDHKSKRLHSYDGRETAPAKAREDWFIAADGRPLNYMQAVLSKRSIGVPGTIAALKLGHQQHGAKTWAKLFAPAIHLAEDGFAISPRLARLIERDKTNLIRDPQTRRYFLQASGDAKPEGSKLVNTAYAASLRLLATDPQAIYRGELAKQISDASHLSLNDLASYQAIERKPVCSAYRQWQLCGMGPPSSGGIAVGQILGMLENYSLSKSKEEANSWRLLGDASRLAFADRDRYVADPDHIDVPSESMLSKSYLQRRSKQLNQTRALNNSQIKPGELRTDSTHSAQTRDLEQGTTNLVARDAAGNIAIMTSSIEQGFGARRMVGGFLLNNQLTDFSFIAVRDGKHVANRPGSSKRPRSSMAPTIVFDATGEPALALGSAGGSRIIGYVSRVLIGVLDWQYTLQQAISQPHRLNRYGAYELETHPHSEQLAKKLNALGYKVRISPLNSGLHGIWRQGETWHSGVDPRREGSAAAVP